MFDASAKSTSGHSLNDLLEIGPNLYPHLAEEWYVCMCVRMVCMHVRMVCMRVRMVCMRVRMLCMRVGIVCMRMYAC